jgi:hypothetical protein
VACAACTTCCAAAVVVERFNFWAEARAIESNHSVLTGAEILTNYLVTTLGTLFVLYLLLKMVYGNDKAKIMDISVTFLVSLLVLIQYYHIYFAAIRLPRHTVRPPASCSAGQRSTAPLTARTPPSPLPRATISFH